jgi:Flp pilus assembly protein TadG
MNRRRPAVPGIPTPTCRSDRGAALVELALALPFLAVMVFGTVDAGRAFSLQSRLTNMAREGAFYAQYHPSDVVGCSPSSITSVAQREDSSLAGTVVTVADGTTGSTITNNCGAAPVPGQRIKVKVTSQMSILAPLIAVIVGPNLAISSTSEVVVQG